MPFPSSSDDLNPVVLTDLTATLDSNGLSAAVDLHGTTLVGIRTPASMTGTTLTFRVGDDDGANFLPLYKDDNTAVSVTIDGTAKQFRLNPADFAGIRYLKIDSGSASDDGKVLTLVTRPV